MRTLFAFVLFVLFAAFVLSVAKAHGPYTHLRSRGGLPCCDGSDCAPYEETVTEVRGGYFLHDGVFVPSAKALPSFDHRFHRCDWPEPGMTLCFLVPAVTFYHPTSGATGNWESGGSLAVSASQVGESGCRVTSGAGSDGFAVTGHYTAEAEL